jgi:hypothetical protein
MRLKRDAVYHNQESTARVYGERRHEGRPGWNGVCHWKRSGQNGKIRPGIDGERLYILLEDILYVCCILPIIFSTQARVDGECLAREIYFLFGFRFKLRAVNVKFVLSWEITNTGPGERGAPMICMYHAQTAYKITKDYVHRLGWTGIAYDAGISQTNNITKN